MVSLRFVFFYMAVLLRGALLAAPLPATAAIDVFECPLGTNPVFQETWACGQRDLGVFYDTRVSAEDMEQYYRLLFQGTAFQEMKITDEARTWMDHWMANLAGGGTMPAMLPRLLFSNGEEIWSLTIQEAGQEAGKSAKVFLHLKKLDEVSAGAECLSGIPAPYPNSKLMLSNQVHNGGDSTEFYSFQGGPSPEGVLEYLRKGFKDAGWQENPLFDAFRENLQKAPNAQFRMEGKDWKADVYQREGQIALVFADQEEGLPFVFYGMFLRKGNFSIPGNSMEG